MNIIQNYLKYLRNFINPSSVKNTKCYHPKQIAHHNRNLTVTKTCSVFVLFSSNFCLSSSQKNMLVGKFCEAMNKHFFFLFSVIVNIFLVIMPLYGVLTYLESLCWSIHCAGANHMHLPLFICFKLEQYCNERSMPLQLCMLTHPCHFIFHLAVLFMDYCDVSGICLPWVTFQQL